MSRRQDHHLQHHNNVLGIRQNALLEDIKTNTSNININVDSLEVNTDGLETLITATNNKLDTFSGHTNNTITIGDGSTQLRTVPLGYDRSNGKAVSFLVDAAGHQQIDAVDVTAKLDTFAGAGNNNIGEGSSKLQIYNYGRDVSAGNFKPMVVNSSAEQIVALSSVDNAVLDTIASKHTDSEAHLGNIDTGIDVLEACVGSNKVNVNISSGTIALPSGASTEATLSAAEVHLGNIETAVQLIDNAISGSEMQCDIVSSALPTGASSETTLAAAEVHLGNIDTGVDVLEACVGSNKVNVNISSGNISGFATESTLSAAEVHLGNIETAVQLLDNAISGSEMQVDVVSSALPSGASTETTLAAAEVHLGNIDTGVDVLEACVGSNKVNVNISSGSISLPSGASSSANQTTIIGHLDGVETKLDTLETTLTAIETDQAALEVLHTATNSKIDTLDAVVDAAEVHLGNIDTGIDVLEACVGSNKVNVNISSGNISGFSTASNQSTIIGHLDGVEGKLDTLETTLTAIETDQAAIEVLLTAANTDHAANEVLLTALEASLTSMEGKQDTQVTHLSEIEGAVETIESAIKAEDAAHSSGDKGMMSLVVRQDSHSDLGADGDYVPMTVNANGELRVTTGGGGISQQIVTTNDAGGTFTIANGASDTSAVITLSQLPAGGLVCFLVEVNAGTGDGFTATVNASRTASSTQYAVPSAGAASFIESSTSAGSKFITCRYLANHYHIVIANSGGADRTYTVSVVS